MPRGDELLEELTRRPLLCDGAMGTQLIAAGLAAGSCGEVWNADRPEAVEAIHRRYRVAGCDLITTNTFGGTASALARHGLESGVRRLNEAGARVARAAVGDDAWVLGDIGPFGDFLEPVGTATEAEVLALFRAQAEALAAGGADAFIVETMADPAEAALAIRAAREVAPRLPVIATFTYNRAAGDAFRTMMGAAPRDAVAAAVEAGADVVGANCGTGLSLADYQRLAGELVAAAGGRNGAPVIVQPNAGAPRQADDGALVYDATPADLAAAVPRLLEAGVRIVGGCCGTTPDHLRAMRGAMPRSS